MSYVVSSPQAYRESAVLSASPARLIVMLYDGARRFLHQAAVAMSHKQIEATHIKLRRAEDIVIHLRQMLDMEQGEVAVRLESIYLYCERELRQARIDGNVKRIEHVSDLLGRLREAWAAIGAE
jgi:flagellar secretion chaperone FliS